MEHLPLNTRLFHHVFAVMGTIFFTLICILLFNHNYVQLSLNQTVLFLVLFWLGNLSFTGLFFIPISEKFKNKYLVLFHMLWGQLGLMALGFFSETMIEISMMLSLATFVFVVFGTSSFTLFPAVIFVVLGFGVILFANLSGRARQDVQLLFWTYSITAFFIASINSYVGNLHLYLSKQNHLIREKTKALEKAQADLVQAKDEAEQSSKSKTRFLAAASHDLRQPLHALELYIGALPLQTTDEKRKHIFCQMEKSAHELRELLNSLFDISRFDAAVAEVNIGGVRINDIVDDLALEFHDLSRQENRPLSVRTSDAIVDTDPILMHQIIRGLVMNALKHAKKGRVLLGFRKRGEFIRCEVWDSGVGIDFEDQPRVFEEFYQAKNSNRNRDQGLGLGLALINRMCLALGHEFGMRSEPEKGTVFWVNIKKSQDTQTLKTAGELQKFAPSPLNTTILCIDDETAILDSLSALLEGWGYKVVTASNAEQALYKIDQTGLRPELIICDYRLDNEENGFDVIQKINVSMNQTIPALMVTGDLDPQIEEQAKSFSYKVLKKPLNPSKLRLYVLNSIKRAEFEQN